jgi:hypothetical protein
MLTSAAVIAAVVASVLAIRTSASAVGTSVATVWTSSVPAVISAGRRPGVATVSSASLAIRILISFIPRIARVPSADVVRLWPRFGLLAASAI